jgi:hypothetical protein
MIPLSSLIVSLSQGGQTALDWARQKNKNKCVAILERHLSGQVRRSIPRQPMISELRRKSCGRWWRTCGLHESSHSTERGDERKGWQSEEGGQGSNEEGREGRRKRLIGREGRR